MKVHRLVPPVRMRRAHALVVLGLTGTGALRTIMIRGVVRIRRGGARLVTRIPRRGLELL
jgi:hypothetical protein